MSVHHSSVFGVVASQALPPLIAKSNMGALWMQEALELEIVQLVRGVSWAHNTRAR